MELTRGIRTQTLLRYQVPGGIYAAVRKRAAQLAHPFRPGLLPDERNKLAGIEVSNQYFIGMF